MNTHSTAPDDVTAYPYLRQVLAPPLAMLPSRVLESYMAERFGEGAAQHYDDYVEGFFDDVGKFFVTAAPVIGNVAGGALRGALSGSSLGLPGIIAGAVAGGAGTALGSYGKGPLKDVGQALNSGVQAASGLSPLGQVGNSLSGVVSSAAQRGLPQLGSVGANRAAGGGAAGTLFSLLRSPEVQQALTALNLGPAGRSTVPVGQAQTPVPTTAIAGLLQSLLGRAVSEAAAESDGSESELQYMLDGSGMPVGDPALERDRLQRVLDLLNQAHLDRLGAAAIRAAIDRAHAADCPQCANSPRRATGWGESDTEAVDEAYWEIDEDDAEDMGEAYAATFDEDFSEDFGEDLGEDAADAIIARATWEMPHGYA